MNDITIYNYNPRFSRQRYLPLGQLYLLSVLRKNGYNADFRDLQFLESSKKEDLLSFFEKSSEIIGIGCISSYLPSLVLTIKELKKKHPGKTIILGGPGPTSVAEEILKICPADIVVMGDGEETIIEVMDHLKKSNDLRNVRGITYRDGNKIRINPPRPRIENLDEIPFPAYDKIDINEYQMIVFVTSRGCPYKCKFCYTPVFWRNGIKFRTIDNVIEEIKLIYGKYNYKNPLEFYDSQLPLTKKRIFELCDKLKKEKIDINWFCYGKINLMNDQIMKKMSESGCNHIFYGTESGSDEILKKINKGFSVKMTENVLRKSKKYFPQIFASFMWGFPFETMGDFKKTVALAEKVAFKLKILTTLSILRPEMGTQIYNEYGDYLTLFLPHISEILLNICYGSFKTIKLLHKNEDIFETFKKQPNIILTYYRYKTPNFYKKVKIFERFTRKLVFYSRMKKHLRG